MAHKHSKLVNKSEQCRNLFYNLHIDISNRVGDAGICKAKIIKNRSGITMGADFLCKCICGGVVTASGIARIK